METTVYYFEHREEYSSFPGVRTTYIELDPALFGCVEWRTVYVAITHPMETRLLVTLPPFPPFRTCLYDLIGKFIGLPFPELTDAEREILQFLPCGFRLADFRRSWPNELPRIEYDWKRLNYYLGLYDWSPTFFEYIHPELDRPLVAEEIAAIEANREAANGKQIDWLYSLEYVDDERCNETIGPLSYNLTHEIRELPISNYRALRKSKRWVHPNRIELL